MFISLAIVHRRDQDDFRVRRLPDCDTRERAQAAIATLSQGNEGLVTFFYYHGPNGAELDALLAKEEARPIGMADVLYSLLVGAFEAGLSEGRPEWDQPPDPPEDTPEADRPSAYDDPTPVEPPGQPHGWRDGDDD